MAIVVSANYQAFPYRPINFPIYLRKLILFTKQEIKKEKKKKGDSKGKHGPAVSLVSSLYGRLH